MAGVVPTTAPNAEAEALKAALRAFTTYRICDVGLLTAGVMIHRAVGSGDFERLFNGVWPNAQCLVSPGNATLVSLLLVFAAMGKSAQVPFSNWLPRAMEGRLLRRASIAL